CHPIGGRALTLVGGDPRFLEASTCPLFLSLPKHRGGLPLRGEAEANLKALAGPETRLRGDQLTAIEALVVGQRRVLCVQRTGWGKSAVYFVATALLRSRGAGPTLIVSPLLALMFNQIEAAGRAGLVARTINSANIAEWNDVYDQVLDGEID